MNVVELMNNIAFGGPYKEKLHSYMSKHIKEIDK